ncbi:FAD-dependent oxidoreductase [Hydrogenophaga sp.]|uniref:NAD(P)/FAD-dependent oxidoreductase n=1 Tax=Hydrogenophaga sp. TaxID=1904254 RepID=UPI002636740C|nr:FAD-dependent oxidoreductase [Hydrogenophaga sp.]MCW5653216.1 FAD-dependent oxidoreductase [Hydrogenophaga sp.]
MRTIAVVGASLAGLHAARTLRAEGFEGQLVMVGEECARPYDRPPLSKQFLSKGWTAEQVALEDAQAPLQAEWRLGCRATGLDLGRRELALDSGERLGFDGLVIATGTAVRRLPLNAVPGTHVVRTLEDATALAAALDAQPERVAVVGGGFIGLEVAASCRERGLAVTLIEPAAVPLGRVLGAAMGGAITALHTARGVDCRTGVSVLGHEVDARGRISALRLSDGSRVAASVVVVAIGVVPATDWLEGSGLRLDDGVLCDETCLAAPGVVAAGDVARWHNRRTGETRRVEHWDNAVRQGRHAARRLLDADGSRTAPFEVLPWFWSDQYDRKIQLYGSALAHDEVRVVQGSAEDGRFMALYRRGDRLCAVLCVNMARALPPLRSLLETGCAFDDAVASARAVAA